MQNSMSVSFKSCPGVDQSLQGPPIGGRHEGRGMHAVQMLCLNLGTHQALFSCCKAVGYADGRISTFCWLLQWILNDQDYPGGTIQGYPCCAKQGRGPQLVQAPGKPPPSNWEEERQ